MKEMPGGHAGAKTTWRKLHKNYPGIEVSLQTVSDYAQACTVFQKAGNTTQPAITRVKTLSINNAQSTARVTLRVFCTILILPKFWKLSHPPLNAHSVIFKINILTHENVFTIHSSFSVDLIASYGC